MSTIRSARFEEVKSSRDSCVFPSKMAINPTVSYELSMDISFVLEFILLTIAEGVSSRLRHGSKADGRPVYTRARNYQT